MLRFLTPLALLAFAAAPAAAQKDPPVPDTVTFEKGVEYTNPDNQHLALNIARPKGDGPFPCVLCIHGGGFRAGNREGYNGQIVRLAEKGYVAVTVSYRLAPKYPFPAAIHDTKAAVRWLRANAKKYGIDPDRIGVTGSSAGGHLAQFLAVTGDVKEFEGDGGNPTHSSKVSCVVNVYGPSDFTKSYGKSVDAAEVLPLFLGGNLEKARPLHIKASPLYWVTPNAAPTLCIHGTEDKYVAFEQAEWLVDKLKAANVEADLLKLEGAGHGFKGKDAETAEKALVAFFDKHLKKQGRAMADPGKVALVTGAGSGIGRAVALALVREGYRVVLAGRRADALAATAALAPAGSSVLSVPTDVTDPESVRALFAETKAAFGRLDVLFNNAGMSAPAIPLEDLTFEQWKKVVDVNLTGVFLCTQEAFKVMKAQAPRGGRIINNGSISATAPRPNSAPYTATKHAVTGLTKSTSLDGRKYDIACGQIDIGNAATEMTSKMTEGVPQANGTIAVEPRMDVENVARAVVYMASLSLDANVLFMTVMATQMPLVGRG